MKKIITLMIAVGSLVVGGQSYAKDTANKTVIDLSVTEKGFEPASIDVKPGSDVVLKVTRKTDSTCVKEIHVPSKKIKTELPLNKLVTVALGKLEKGEVRFTCGMNMVSGQVIVK